MLREHEIFEINERTLPMIRQMAEHMPGGFFIYRAGGNEEFLLANQAVLRLAGCETMEQFAALTGNSFRGFVHPEELVRVEEEIEYQIRHDALNNDYVEYRIRCRDGSEKRLRDNGHLVSTECYGDVFFVFVDDAGGRQKNEPDAQPHRISQEPMLPESMLQHHIVPNDSAKKTVLVVEDSELNREILTELLKDEFRIITAENGEEGIRKLKEHRDRLSLVLLDVYMPVCSGFEFLEQTQRDPFLSSVPVIVTTGSDKHEDEEKCLRLGAIDFITKPYNPETMLGRIHNTIRLHESISELSVVEFDRLTGLYTMSAFLHHAAQRLSESDADFDLGLLSLPDFSTINRVYGERRGDEVLQYFGTILKENLPDILLARQGSNFFALSSAGQGDIIHGIQAILLEAENDAPVSHTRTRLGLYRNVDKQQPVSVLCDRIKLAVAEKPAADGICRYDTSMERKQLEEKNLLTGFEAALENREFVIWIQPKVDVTTGRIVAGEALVRWIDSAGNFISPGAFIPLFEREGQIRQLDEYIFRAVCAYQRQRKEAGKRMIPISCNLSRNSLFDKGIIACFRRIAAEEQAELAMVPLEITESAASSEKLIADICESFVQAGFVLQMDDFGTGYSSLSSLATLPFSVVKLDKSLIDRIGSGKGDVIIKSIIETVHELDAKIVAEGVEEKYQMDYLAMVGCDQIQGYYFSPPKKLPLFEELMEQEAPFADRYTAEVYQSDSIIRISAAELTQYLRVCRRVFSAARVLEADCCAYCMAGADGTLDQRREPCFAIWDREERCANCISLKAMQTKKTEQKFEVFENEVYSVYSVYLEVDGTPRILELLSAVGAGVLHGYENNISLLHLMQSGHSELYLDVQLGTLNRRFFEECRESMRNITAIAMIDIDNFKEINDRYGHPAGDSVLAEIARAVRSVIRDSDYLIRMGGDEMMICFSGMKPRHLGSKLEDIRKAAADIRFAGHEGLRPTVSVGAAVCREYSEAAREQADRALYEAKRTKNHAVIREDG